MKHIFTKLKCLVSIFIMMTLVLAFPIYLIATKKPYINHHVTLGDVMPGDEINVILNLIKKGNADDRIYIHFNSDGGKVVLMLDLVDAMRKSKADIICVLDNHAYSVAGILFMSCDNKIIYDNAQIHAHMVICPGQKKCPFIIINGYLNYVHKVYKNVFTDEEWFLIEAGADVFLSGKVLKERLRHVY